MSANSHRPRGPAPGFTLIELTVVLAIITLLLTMAVGAHYSWKRYSALDAAERQVVATLALARQHAISSGRMTMFLFANGEIPYEDDVLRNAIRTSNAGGDLTNSVSGWCAVVAFTNVLDEAEVEDVFEGQDAFPIVGAPVEFGNSIQWGDTSSPFDESSPRFRFFLPDGSVWESDYAADAFPTNVLFGPYAGDSSKRPAVHRRVIEVLPQSGAARALTREERERLWPSRP